jgi:serine protease inhibitor
MANGYDQFDFKGMDKQVAALDFDVSVNRYDIFTELGEDNIRKTIADAYEKAKADPDSGLCGDEGTTEEVVNQFVKDLKPNYKSFAKSTDFEFYVDDDVKVFAKDLKTYDGITLQYVGIMPDKKDLDEYIKDTKAEDLNKIISNLKETKYDTFKEGVITNVRGSVPVFKFDYELKLLEDLKKLGISDVFDKDKADLSKLTSSKAYIDSAIHKANIEFSNDGIKAAAATEMGGKGGDGCGFYYSFDVPVETIEIYFNKPYMFMVRDKDSGEIWFMGTVYEPIDAYSTYGIDY